MLPIIIPAVQASPVNQYELRLTSVSADGAGSSDKVVSHRTGVKNGRGDGVLE